MGILLAVVTAVCWGSIVLVSQKLGEILTARPWA